MSMTQDTIDTREEDTTYNGWTNYETWCVNLWLTNEESTANILRELATLPLNQSNWTYEVQRDDALKEWVDDLREQWEPGAFASSLLGDLLTHALGAVNWREIIKAAQED